MIAAVVELMTLMRELSAGRRQTPECLVAFRADPSADTDGDPRRRAYREVRERARPTLAALGGCNSRL